MIFVWSNVYDKTEQPWEAPSWEAARAEVCALQKAGHRFAGVWDIREPWPFGDEPEKPRR
jgi:hypothetical protein